MLQALSMRTFSGVSPTICFVTRRAQPPDGSDVRPGSAMLWGLARSLEIEQKQWSVRCVDLDENDMDRLYFELRFPDKETQVACGKTGPRFKFRSEKGTGHGPLVRQRCVLSGDRRIRRAGSFYGELDGRIRSASHSPYGAKRNSESGGTIPAGANGSANPRLQRRCFPQG